MNNQSENKEYWCATCQKKVTDIYSDDWMIRCSHCGYAVEEPYTLKEEKISEGIYQYNKIPAHPVEEKEGLDKDEIIAEQDRMIGELTRKVNNLEDTESKRVQWLDKAKKEAGYDRMESFDNVWKEVLAKSKSALPDIKEKLQVLQETIKHYPKDANLDELARYSIREIQHIINSI